jgi:hypothetical protein
MATELPVRIEFQLPEGWQTVESDEHGEAFVALHKDSREHGFPASISLSGGLLPEGGSLEWIADESIAHLYESDHTVRPRAREKAPTALTQILDLSTTINGAEVDLVQCQTFLELRDANDPGKTAVLEVVLTGTHEQAELLIGDFQDFVATVRPVDNLTPRGGK